MHGSRRWLEVIGAILLVIQLRGVWRTVALVPTLYLVAFVWENRLIEEAYARTHAFLQDGGGLDRQGRLEPGIHYMLPPRRQTVVSLAQ